MNEIVRQFGKFKFFIREGSSDEKAIKEVILKNAYQRKNFRIEPGERWLDLGGNIGAFTVLAASLGAKVRTFEPDPISFAILKRNLELNGLTSNVELNLGAVLVTPEPKIVLHVNSANKNYWRSSVLKTWRGGFDVEVPAFQFRQIYRPEENIKMDIEGYEMPLLESMQEFPQKMVFEWSFDIDNSILRYKNVIEKLKKIYPEVIYGKFDESKPVWPSNWFPPAKMVWCKK